MTIDDVIKAAIPDVDAMTAKYILWSRTPYPFDLNAKMLYQAASTYRRARANKIRLCDHCSNRAADGRFECVTHIEMWARMRAAP